MPVVPWFGFSSRSSAELSASQSSYSPADRRGPNADTTASALAVCPSCLAPAHNAKMQNAECKMQNALRSIR